MRNMWKAGECWQLHWHTWGGGLGGRGQDKDYLHRQMNDVSIKYANAEERLQLLNMDLENVKIA